MSTESKLQNLLLDSLSFETMGARLRNVKPELSKTCQWLRNHNHFLAWIDHDRPQGSDDFLWLRGKPGSGTSTIMRNTLFWVEKECPANLTLSYFFDARSPFQLAKSTLGLYRSVLHQLLSSCADVRDLFVDRFSPKVGTTEVVEAWTEEEVQNFLIDVIDGGRPTALIIFVDALDESHDDDIQELVAFLEDLQQRATDSGIRLRICFSSRHYPHISIAGNCIIIEKQPGHEADIDRYVRIRLVGGEQAGMDKIRQKLLSKAAGVFLWVALMVPRLNQQFNRGEGLAAMTEELERAPVKIQDLFYDILTKDRDEIDNCITLLRCVLCAKRPLLPQELYRAVKKYWYVGKGEMASSSTDAVFRYLLTCSRGLVELTVSERPTVQFIHETVRETLANDDIMHHFGLSTPLNFRAQVCHASMVEICLSCLLASHETQSDSQGGSRRQLPQVEAFALYSAKFWWQHMHETTGSLRQPLLKLVSSLLTDQRTRLKWIGLYDIDTLLLRLRKRKLGTQSEELFEKGSPLYYATLANIPELVREYVVASVDVDITDGCFDVALGAAACLGHEEIVQILLEAGIAIDESTYSPLMAAVGNNHKRVVAMLLINGADVDRRTPQGTALVEAVSQGHEEIVRLLLQHGADINGPIADVEGNTMLYVPLYTAVSAGRTNMVRLLLEHGASVKTTMGWSPMGHVLNRRDREMLELLLQWKVDLDFRSLDYILEWLRRLGDWELVFMLEEARLRTEAKEDNEDSRNQTIATERHQSTVMSISNVCN